jgi:shikimate kinase
MKIVLLGYMASGKSLIGNNLANVLGCNFIDLDDYIEKKESETIQNVFLNKGEIYFRKIEHNYLKEIISKKENMVLSLGGGTPCYYNNMKLLLECKNVITIYLNVSINEIINRLSKEKNKRPLVSHIKEKQELKEFVGKHLFERANFYRKSNIILDANLSIDTIIENSILQLF